MNNGARFGVLNEETGRYHVLVGDPLYSGFEQSGEVITADEAHFVAPMLPRSKVLGFAQQFGVNTSSDVRNSVSRSETITGNADCSGSENFCAELTAYLKPNTSVVGPNVPVIIPQWAAQQRVSLTPQLGLIVSRPCKEVPLTMASEVIFGYLLVAAVSLPEFAATDSARAYAFDTSCLAGPILETGMPTGDFAFSFDVGADGYDASISIDADQLAYRISAAAEIATLLPGDIILTGPLGKALPAVAGDKIVFQHTKLGTLQNPVLQ